MPFMAVAGSAPSIWLALLSLCTTALLSCGMSLEPVLSLLTSPAKPVSRVGAFQRGMPQRVPVKDLIWRGLRSHLRHGLPVRSKARKFALMLPVLALGPRRCVETGLGPAKGPFLAGSWERSMVPSGLR
jgi:hypothetical protein